MTARQLTAMFGSGTTQAWTALTRSRVMRVGLALGFALSIPLVVATPAQACDCSVGTMQQRLKWSDAVFTGEIVDRSDGRLAESGPVDVIGSFTYTIEVDRVYKGEVAEVQQLVAGKSGASCGVVFPDRGPILVFGNAGKSTLSGTVEPGQYWTGLCSGSETTSAVPASFGEGAPPSGGDGGIGAATATDPDVEAAGSAVSPVVLVAGAAVLGVMMVSAVFFLRRRGTARRGSV